MAVRTGETAEARTADIVAPPLRARVSKGGGLRSFNWRCDPYGTIIWTDAPDRAGIIGRNLRGPQWGEGPLRRRSIGGTMRVRGSGPCKGDWTLAGEPIFDGPDSSFTGFGGKATAEDNFARPGLSALSADGFRSLAHEVRTPLNAIMGFAELMAGGLPDTEEALGARVTRIGLNGARIAAVIDALDESVQVVATEPWRTVTPGVILGRRFRSMAGNMPGPRGAAITWYYHPDLPAARLSIRAIEYLVREASLLVLGYAEEGEALRGTISGEQEANGSGILITLMLPGALRDGLAEDKEPAGDWPFAPRAGAAFSLDLVKRTALAVHASAEIERDRICLRIPAVVFE